MISGILVVNKPYGYTSRDAVNIISHKFNTRKVGHTGTLDPIATGVLVVPIGKALKISELLTSEVKSYRARVILGYETDMLDITGKETKRNIPNCTKEEIEEVLSHYLGKSLQEVPIYSAVKVNGKKLYEYARSNTKVTLPQHEINVYDLKLLGSPLYLKDTIEFDIECTVSKGTYIRGLIRDIGHSLNTYGTMKELIRTKQGLFTIEDSYTIDEIKNNKYKLLSIREALPNLKVTKVDENLSIKIKNGQVLDPFFKEEMSLIVDEHNKELAIYKKDGTKAKPYKMFEVE